MQPHEQRVVEEANDLAEKHEKLMIFLKSEKFKELEQEDKNLLITQEIYMEKYLCMLKRRIARFKVTPC